MVTIGGYLSNHVRATVMAARELGLQSHALIIGMGQKVSVSSTFVYDWMIAHYFFC